MESIVASLHSTFVVCQAAWGCSVVGSGIFAIMFSLLVILTFLRSSLITLGILLGMNLVIFGMSCIVLGFVVAVVVKQIANSHSE
jgi:uncharacterized membrane protein HdeD (DUF308 family)